MKKKALLIVVTVMMILTIGFTACKQDYETDEDDFAVFDDLNEKPTASAISSEYAIDESKVVLSSEESTDADVCAAAAYIYNLANENQMNNVDFYATYSKGSGYADIKTKEDGSGLNLRGSMSVRERTCKDGDAWYFEELAVVTGCEKLTDGDEATSVDSLVGVVQRVLQYGNRKYTPDGNTFYVNLGNTDCLDSNSLVDFLNHGTNYDKISKSELKKSKLTKDAFYEKYCVKESHIELDNTNMTAECLTSAAIIDKGDYYSVRLTVNIDSDALLQSEESLRQSASSNDLKYVRQIIDVDIWKVGLFKSYHTDNGWAAHILMLSGASNNLYQKYWTYNRDNVSTLAIPQEDVEAMMTKINGVIK